MLLLILLLDIVPPHRRAWLASFDAVDDGGSVRPPNFYRAVSRVR